MNIEREKSILSRSELLKTSHFRQFLPDDWNVEENWVGDAYHGIDFNIRGRFALNVDSGDVSEPGKLRFGRVDPALHDKLLDFIDSRLGMAEAAKVVFDQERQRQHDERLAAEEERRILFLTGLREVVSTMTPSGIPPTEAEAILARSFMDINDLAVYMPDGFDIRFTDYGDSNHVEHDHLEMLVTFSGRDLLSFNRPGYHCYTMKIVPAIEGLDDMRDVILGVLANGALNLEADKKLKEAQDEALRIAKQEAADREMNSSIAELEI